MSILRKLFHKKSNPDIPQTPEWKTIVEMMCDQNLDGYAQEVVQVIYSKDRTKRYVILKDEKGFFTYQLEAIYPYDRFEWQYVSSHKDVLPAMWEPFRGSSGKSIFESTEELIKEMREEPEYKQYF